MTNEYWNTLILGGIVGFLSTVLLSLFSKFIWNRFISESSRNNILLIYQKIISNTLFTSKIKITDALEEINNYSKSRVFMIRIGDLYLNDIEYKERMKYIVESEYIWDWHIFTKKINGSQSEKWLNNFYHNIDNAYKVDINNTTTNLTCMDKSKLVGDDVISSLFERYKINKNFDDIIIYGVLKDIHEYPSLREVVVTNLENFYFQGIKIFSDDGNNTVSINLMRDDFAQIFLKSIVNIDIYKYQLFVNSEFTEKQIYDAEKFVEYVIE